MYSVELCPWDMSRGCRPGSRGGRGRNWPAGAWSRRRTGDSPRTGTPGRRWTRLPVMPGSRCRRCTSRSGPRASCCKRRTSSRSRGRTVYRRTCRRGGMPRRPRRTCRRPSVCSSREPCRSSSALPRWCGPCSVTRTPAGVRVQRRAAPRGLRARDRLPRSEARPPPRAVHASRPRHPARRPGAAALQPVHPRPRLDQSRSRRVGLGSPTGTALRGERQFGTMRPGWRWRGRYQDEERDVEHAAADAQQAGGAVGEEGAEQAGQDDAGGEHEYAVAPVVEREHDEAGQADQQRQHQRPFAPPSGLARHQHVTPVSRPAALIRPGSLRRPRRRW